MEQPCVIFQTDGVDEQLLMESDEVVMYHVKVDTCNKGYAHDITTCPWLHPGERARRRDPRAFAYSATLCPEIKKDKVCARGINCPYSHNIFEYFLHPDRYRTRMCDFGKQCTRKLCFFAHTPEQLRVTAKSLAAQQAQANSGKGKASKAKAASASSRSSDLQLSSASANAENAARAAGASTAAGSAGAGQSPAAVELIVKLCADEGALSALLQKLGAAPDTSLDSATTAALLSLLDTQDLPMACSSGSSDGLLAGAAAAAAGDADMQGTDGSQGSSPRTPTGQKIQLPAEAAAAQRKDTGLTPSAAGSWASTSLSRTAAGAGVDSSSISVQEHIQNVMQGKVTAEQVQRDAARRRLSSGPGASAYPPAPLHLPAHSPGAQRLLPMQRPSLDILSPGMQSYLTDPQLCSPAFGAMGVLGCTRSPLAVSAGGPAQLQVPGLAGDIGPLPGSAINSYGAGCILQTMGSVDTVGSAGAAGFSSGALGSLGGNVGPLMSPQGSSDPGSLDMLSPALLQQLSLQAQPQQVPGAAVGADMSPMLGAPKLSPGMASPAHAAAAAQMAQQQAAMLLKQQQQLSSAALAPAGAFGQAWGGDGHGVSSMMGGTIGAGFGAGRSPAMASCLVG